MGPNQRGRPPQRNQPNTAVRWSHNTNNYPNSEQRYRSQSRDRQYPNSSTDTTNQSHRHHNKNTINAPKALPINQIHQAHLRVPTAGITTLKILNAIAVKILNTSLKIVGQKTQNDCVDPRNKLQTQIL